jgi:hypothetical protein
MSARYSFAIDRRLGLVGITMSGLFTPADVAAFLEARGRAHADLGWPRNGHVTLNDVSAMSIQPQETVAAFQAVLADVEFRSRRLAFVVSQTLARRQLTRAVDSRHVRCFTDADEARAWLFDEAERRAA